MQPLKPLRPRILQPYPLGINVQYQQEQRLQRAKMDAVTNAIAKRTPTLITDPILNQRVRDYYSGDPRPGEVIGGKIYGAVEWGALLAGISATVAGTVMMFVPGAQAGGAAAIVKGAALTGGAIGAGVGLATGDEATFRATNRIIKDTLVETFTGHTGRGLLNTLMTVGKSMDLIMGGEAIRASIHAAITGEPVGARILRAYGISPTGRETADFEVIRKELGIDLGGFPNIVVDMIGELITDPGFVAGVGKHALGIASKSKKNIAKAVAADPKIQTVIKQNDVLAKSLNDPKLNKRLVNAIFENDNDEIFAVLASRGASRENLYEFIESFSKQVNDAVATKTANKLYAIFNAVDSVDDFFTFTMFKAAVPTTMLIKPTWRFAKNFVLSPKFLQQTDWTAGQKFAYIMRGGKVEYKLEKEIYDETFRKTNKELADYLINPKTKDGNVDGDLGIAKSKFSDTFKTDDPTIQKQIKEDIDNLKTEWTKTSDELKETKKLKNEEGSLIIRGKPPGLLYNYTKLRERELELAKRLAKIKKALSILDANKTDLESLQKIISEFYHLFIRKNFSKALFTKNINDLIILIKTSEQHQSLIDLFADSVYGDLLHFIRNNIDVETKDYIQGLYKEKVNSLAKKVPTKKGAESEVALKKLQKELASEITFRDMFFLDKINKNNIPGELITKVEMDTDDGYKEALDVIDAVLDTYFNTPSHKVTQEEALSLNFLDNVLRMIKQYTDHNSDIAKVYSTIKLMKEEIFSSSYRFTMSDSKGAIFFKQGSKHKQYVRNISEKNIELLEDKLNKRLDMRIKYYETHGEPASTLEQINILKHNIGFIKTLKTEKNIDGIVDFYDLSSKSLLIHLESERFTLDMYNELESSFHKGVSNKKMVHDVSMELLDRIEYSKGIIRKALKDMETYKKNQPHLKKLLEDYLNFLNKVASRTTLDNKALFEGLETFNARQAQISASLIVSEIFSTVSEDDFFKTYVEQHGKSILDEDAIGLILASDPVKTEEDKIMEEIFGARQTRLSLVVSKLIEMAKIDFDVDSFVWASIQKITNMADEGLRRILRDFNSNEITTELSDDPEVLNALSLLMRNTVEKLEQTMIIAAEATDSPFIKTAFDAFNLFGKAYPLWKDNGIEIYKSFGKFLDVLTGARADWLRLRKLNYMFKDVIEIVYDTTKKKIVAVDNGSKNLFVEELKKAIDSGVDAEDVLEAFRRNIIAQNYLPANIRILKTYFDLLKTENEKLYKIMKDNLKINDIDKFFNHTRPVVINKTINNFDKHIRTYTVLKEAQSALQKPDILFSLGGEPIKDFNSEAFWESKRTAFNRAEEIRVAKHNQPILDMIAKIEARIKEIEDDFEKVYNWDINETFSASKYNYPEDLTFRMLYARRDVLKRLEVYKNLLGTKNRQLIEPKEFKKSYTYIVVDTETTSKNANKAGLRQLTVRVVDSSGSEISTDGPKFDFLFDEKYGNEFEVDPEAEKVHQITEEYLQKNKHKVKSREEAGNLLNEFLEGLMQSDSAPILVAHNATYDGEVLLHNLPILSEYKDILPVLDTYSLFKNVNFGVTLSGLSNESILRATGIKVVDTVNISEIRKLGPKDVPELQLLRDEHGNILETYFNGVPLHNAEADTNVTANLLNFVLKRIQKIADGKHMDVIDLIQKPSENLFTEYGFTYKQLSDIKEILDEYIEQTNMFEFGSDMSDILAQAESEGAEGPLYRFLVDNDIAQADHTGRLATTPFTDMSKLNKLMYIYNNSQLGSENLTTEQMLVNIVAEELNFSRADIEKLGALIKDVYDPTHEIDLLFDKANTFNNLFKSMQRDTAVPIKNRDLVALEIIYNGILQNVSLYEFMDLLEGTSSFSSSADVIFQDIFNEFRTKNIAGISEVINYFKKIEEATSFYDQMLSNIPEGGIQRDKMFRMLRALQDILKNKPKTLEEYDELVQKTIFGINGTEDTLSTKVTSVIYNKAIESYSDISKAIISLDTNTSNHLFQLIFQNIMRPLGTVFSNADDMIKKYGIPAESAGSLLDAFRKLQSDFRSALETFRRPLREAKKYNRANQFNLVSVDQFFKDTKIQSGFDLISRNNEFGLKFSQDIHSSKAKKKIAYEILDGYTKYEEPLNEADKWFGYIDYSNVGYGKFFNSVLDMLGYKTGAGTQAATFSLRKFRDVFKMLDIDELKTKLAWRYLQEHDSDFIRRIAIMVDNTDYVKQLHIEEAKVEEFKLRIQATILYILEKDETLNRNLVGMLDKDLGKKTIDVIKSYKEGYYDLVSEVTTEKPIYDYKGYKKEPKHLVEKLNRFSKETVIYGALRNGSDMFDNMKGSASAEQLSNFFKNHKEYTLVFFDGKQLIRIQATDLVTMQNVLKSEGMFSVVGYDEFIGIRKSWEEKLRKISDDTLLSKEAKHEYMPVIEPKWLRTIQDINTLLIKIPSLMLSIPFMVSNSVAAYLQNIVNNGGRPLKAMGKVLKAQSELHKFYDIFSAISTLEDSYKYFGDVNTLEKTWVEILKNKKTRDEFISFLENNNSPKALKIKEFVMSATDKDYEILQKASEFLSTQAAFGELKNLQVHEQIRLEKEAKYQQLLNKSKRDNLEEEEFWKLNKEPNLNYPKDANIKTLEDEYNYLKKIREDQKVFNNSKSLGKSPIDKLKETLGVEATTIYKRYHILQERFSGQFNKAMSRVWSIRLFKWWSNFNNNIETVFRYAMMDQAMDSGKSLAKASLEVIDRHFIYSDKSIAERFVELMIPFASYPMKAYVLFSDMMTDYTAMKMLYTWYDESWGNEKAEDSAYLNYRKLRGDVPINIAGQDKLLGLTNSFGEALQGMVPQELGRVGMNKLSPIIKAPITAIQGNVGRAATQLPGGGAIGGVVRSITELQNTGRFSLGTMTNMTNNFYSQEQARYRSSYRQFPNHRNYYNDMYTKTGFSRVEMRMQNTNLNNLQYRVSDILYTYKRRY